MHPEHAQSGRNSVFDRAQSADKAALTTRNSPEKPFTNNGV
jgi:hypothetical protein